MVSISFQTAFVAIFQIFLMGGVGFFLLRRKLLQEEGLRILSWLSINVTFPLFIFYQIINNFNPSSQPYWWTYPLINSGLCVTGAALASVIVYIFSKKQSKEWVAVSSLHNAGYIPLLLVTMLPFGEKTAEVYAYIILTIVGFDLCLWTLGVWFISSHQKPKMSLSNFINPPLISMFLAFVLILVGGKFLLPEIVMKPIKIIGDSSLALAMITIGGNLALTHFKKIQWKQVGSAVLIKIVILPLLALLFINFFHISSLWGFILMIQACMPTSITLSVLGRYYESPNQNLINQTIFITHLLCGLTIPLFLALYAKGF